MSTGPLDSIRCSWFYPYIHRHLYSINWLIGFLFRLGKPLAWRLFSQAPSEHLHLHTYIHTHTYTDTHSQSVSNDCVCVVVTVVTSVLSMCFQQHLTCTYNVTNWHSELRAGLGSQTFTRLYTPAKALLCENIAAVMEVFCETFCNTQNFSNMHLEYMVMRVLITSKLSG